MTQPNTIAFIQSRLDQGWSPSALEDAARQECQRALDRHDSDAAFLWHDVKETLKASRRYGTSRFRVQSNEEAGLHGR
jgi:hypothetical protein